MFCIYCVYIVSSGTFSVGFNFNYYDRNNPLFMKPKYENLKEEILHYQYINIQQYKQGIIIKANEYQQTQLVQSMKARIDYDEYGISEDEVLSMDRLMTIILYTDYTDLSRHFSSTFRKSNLFEPLQTTKYRHSKYYWMSKLLRETVRIYGHNYEDEGLRDGPYYCGMSKVMTMPEFAMKLFSPSSTSCHIEVAMKFSGESGLIIEFNNEGGLATVVKGLEVSWVSRFAEEDERYG